MCMLILHTIITPQSRAKADLDSTIFAYNYRAQLAYVTTFDHPHVHTYDIHNVSYECCGSNLYDTICRKVMMHVSRAR